MYLSNTYLEEGFPFHGRKQKQMEAFLKKSGLTPDSFYSYSVLLTDQNGSILGCGSRYENVLKCIAIDETYQGEGLLAQDCHPTCQTGSTIWDFSPVFIYQTIPIRQYLPTWDFIKLLQLIPCFF